MRATAFVLALLIAGPALAQVTKREMPGIRNYSRVDATVGCGGAVDPAAMAALKSEGYVSVINLRQAAEPGADIEAGRAAAQTAGLKYLHMPFNVAAPDAKVVDGFLAAVADKSNQPVFIHCGSANRVGGTSISSASAVGSTGWPACWTSVATLRSASSSTLPLAKNLRSPRSSCR